MGCGSSPHEQTIDDAKKELYLWVLTNDVENVRNWLEEGGDANGTYGEDKRSWIFAARDLEMFDLLIEHGADVHYFARTGETSFHEACGAIDEDYLMRFIELGVDINLPTKRDEYHESIAVERGWDKLDEPPEYHFPYNRAGRTPLMTAAGYGNPERVQQLIDLGADVAAQTPLGTTAIHNAAVMGGSQCVRVLLENGADASVESVSGFTPLHVATRYAPKYADTPKHVTEVMKTLVEAGADLEAKDSFGKTPIDYARESDDREFRAEFERFMKTIE